MKIKPNQKHLTFEQRNIIEQGLNSGFSLIEIANSLKKDPTTISKEIKRNRIKKEANIYNSKNICKNLVDCNLRDICKAGCKVFCKTCEICNERCKDFTPKVCKRLTRYPYTCNNCTRKSPCRLEKYYYKALTSFNTYKSTLSEARRGINLTPDELTHIDSIVSPLIKQGQSISHIHETQNINCSKSSLYNYVEKNYLSVCNLDLARKVRFKKRKQHREPTKDTKIRNGRTYSDFLQYLDKNLDIPVIEMDTVEGKKGGKVLLTLFFRNTKLMLAFIMNDKTSDSVLEVFNRLEKVLGDEESFEKLFPVILTDNGSEFSNPIELEFNKEGIGRTKLFYARWGKSRE